MVIYGSGKLGGGVHSTTDETIIGTWIDGKPLYQKIVDCGKLLNAKGQKSVAHGITNVKLFVGLYGVAVNSNLSTLTIPDVHISGTGTAVNYYIRLAISDTNIVISQSMDRSEFTAYVTVQYTKTTD